MIGSVSAGPVPGADRQHSEATCWQEIEWGDYVIDLPLWEELAPPGARVLELGCGAGRVALHLGARERKVVGVDDDGCLLADLGERAARMGIAVCCVPADATALRLGERFDSVLAPLQLANVVEPEHRAGLLRASRRHLAPGGTLALSFLSEAGARELVDAYDALGEPRELPEPDVREIDGCVYSSRPLDMRLVTSAQLDSKPDREPPGELANDSHTLVVSRHRVVACTDGRRRETLHEDRFHLFTPELLVSEAAAEGLTLHALRRVPETAIDAAVSVFVFEAASGHGDSHPGGRDE